MNHCCAISQMGKPKLWKVWDLSKAIQPGTKTQEICSSPKAMEASESFDLISTKSKIWECPTPWVPGGQDRADSLVSWFISLPSNCLPNEGVGGVGWLVARSLGCPVTGWACLTASQSELPELVLERRWPHLAGTLYLCPGAQKRPCLGPAVLIPHAPDCPSPSASRKAHFVESKD